MVAFSDPFKYPEDIAYCDDDSGSSSDLHARTRVVSFATSCSLPPPLLPFPMEKIKLDADTGDRSDRAKPAEHVLKGERRKRWEGFQEDGKGFRFKSLVPTNARCIRFQVKVTKKGQRIVTSFNQVPRATDHMGPGRYV